MTSSKINLGSDLSKIQRQQNEWTKYILISKLPYDQVCLILYIYDVFFEYFLWKTVYYNRNLFHERNVQNDKRKIKWTNERRIEIWKKTC